MKYEVVQPDTEVGYKNLKLICDSILKSQRSAAPQPQPGSIKGFGEVPPGFVDTAQNVRNVPTEPDKKITESDMDAIINSYKQQLGNVTTKIWTDYG